MGKVRRVDLYPDEWLVGAATLKPDERGCYITICCLIYSYGGAILDDARDLAKLCNATVEKWERIRDTLLSKGKLRLVDGHLTNGRCETELKKARVRTETAKESGANGGKKSGETRRNRTRVSGENNDLHKPDASEKSKLTTNHQPPTTNQRVELNSSTPRADADAVQPGSVPRSDAVPIIRAFDDAIVAIYGADRCRPYPNQTDHVTAQRWLEAGADLALCVAVFDAGFRSRHAKNTEPPRSLKYFENAVADALAERKRPMPEGTASPIWSSPDRGGAGVLPPVGERAPEPYAEQFSATEHRSWIAPCAIEQAGNEIRYLAPSAFHREHLENHCEQRLRLCHPGMTVRIGIRKRNAAPPMEPTT